MMQFQSICFFELVVDNLCAEAPIGSVSLRIIKRDLAYRSLKHFWQYLTRRFQSTLRTFGLRQL